MTEYAKVSRPEEGASPPEIKAYLAALGRALERIGIDYGEEFAVVPSDSIGTQASLDELEDQLGPFAQDSETSRQAAIDTYERMGKHHRQILYAIALQGYGLTREEIEQVTGLGGNTIRPRVKELIGGGMLVETDRTRTTKRGSRAAVIEATAHGRKELKQDGE
jgi:hypothetical protein